MNRKKLLILAAITAAILIVALPLFALATGVIGSSSSSGAQPIARQVQELFSGNNSNSNKAEQNTQTAESRAGDTVEVASLTDFEGRTIGGGSGNEIVQISVGNNHSLALDTDGNLWTWGHGGHGQLGLGDTNNRPIPTRVTAGAAKWQSVFAGLDHSLALDIDGNLWSWGNNGFGQLGLNGSNDRAIPTQVTAGVAQWQSVSAGSSYSLALDIDGNLWAWGQGSSGKLGLGDTADKPTPTKVTQGATKWQAVSAGSNHSLALDSAGNLWAWGSGGNGRLGLGSDVANKSIPVQVPTGATKWQAVFAGGNHSSALDTDGNLWMWGHGGSGQLGLGDTDSKNIPTKVTQGAAKWQTISAGNLYSLALDTDGNLWAWGAGSNGGLGLGDSANTAIPTKVTQGAAKWQAVPEGGIGGTVNGHSLALDTDGNLWAWGRNSVGQLGKGITTFEGEQGTGTNNWIPWRLAGSLMHTSDTDWTIAADATVPSSGAVGITNKGADATTEIVLNFDRPMNPAITGKITVDNGARVRTAKGVWSDSVRGENTVFTAPLTLIASNTVHTATVSGFADSFTKTEMHEHNWSFETGNIVLPPEIGAEGVIVKVVQAPEGTTIPSFDFGYKFVPVQAELSDAPLVLSRPVSDVPAIANPTLTLDVANIEVKDDIAMAVGTFDLEEMLEGVVFPGGGAYVYNVSEIEDSSRTLDAGAILTGGLETYQVRVFADNTGTMRSYTVYETNESAPGSFDVDKNKVETLLFLGMYTTTSGDDTYNAFEITNESEGEYASLDTVFNYTLTLTDPALGSGIGKVNAEIVKTSTDAQVKEFEITAGVNTFSLKHDEKLVIDTLPSGTRFSVTKAADAECETRADIVLAGAVAKTHSETVGVDLVTDTHIVSDTGRNAVDVINVYTLTMETGLIISSLPAAVALLSLAGLVFLVASKRRNRIEEVVEVRR